jgi:uncharacterized hydrophobic protein (TIGR00271 family)
LIRLSSILKDSKFTLADIPAFESSLFFEGDRARGYIVRFTILLFLSTVIATQGVIGDSTATVIGAMIIAPLMTPIVASTAALMMGNMRRAHRSLLLVALGALGVIAVSAGFGILAVNVIDFDSNTQITARVAPRVLDLIIALAAGAAGAFAMSRDDIADSLPGAAISIALVPPLCVVGIALSAAQWSDAWGALLLFLTNFLSIMLAGGGVFALLGLSGAVTKGMSISRKHRAYRIITLGVLLIAIPLSATTAKVGRDTIAQVKVTNIVTQWASRYPSNIVLKSVLVSGGTVEIIVSGTEKPATIKDLGALIQSEVKQVVNVDLRFLPSISYKFP